MAVENDRMHFEYDKLRNSQRILIEVKLKPIQGDRFQPTGFPDIGAAVYERPDGKRMILLESAQSMANRLEAVCLADNRIDISDELKGIPYVKVKMKDAKGKLTETSSLVEAHRINSPFIMANQEFVNNLKDKAEYGKSKAINWGKVGEALFFYDINSLIHGVFLANLEDGRFKVPRILTAFIEAEGVKEAESGGAKKDHIDPSGKTRAEANMGSDVYGNVIYHRMEYTAENIRAYFNIDLSLIEGYKLEECAKNLLISLSLYKIVKFLSGNLRLRTSCDLEKIGDVIVRAPEGFILPDINQLKENVKGLIAECKEKKLFAEPPETELETEVKTVTDKKKPTNDTTANSPSENHEEEDE
ncbi:MAG: type I-G CRISPR-associated RAMP protein Csb1/Cas7g [Thermoplasmata archaeon]